VDLWSRRVSISSLENNILCYNNATVQISGYENYFSTEQKILPRCVFKKLQFSTGSPDWVYTVSNGKQHRFTKDLNSKTNEWTYIVCLFKENRILHYTVWILITPRSIYIRNFFHRWQGHPYRDISFHHVYNCQFELGQRTDLHLHFRMTRRFLFSFFFFLFFFNLHADKKNISDVGLTESAVWLEVSCMCLFPVLATIFFQFSQRSKLGSFSSAAFSRQAINPPSQNAPPIVAAAETWP